MFEMIPLKYNLRSLAARRTSSVLTIGGFSVVVAILALLLATINGLATSFSREADSNTVVILSRGTSFEAQSYLSRQQYQVIRTMPEIQTADGSLLSPEIVTGFDPSLGEASTGRAPMQTFVRGVTPAAYRVHFHVAFVSGRSPAQGASEMIVGSKLARKYPFLKVGTSIHFGRRNWKIVGEFSDRGGWHESEMWTDIDVLEQDVKYLNGYSSIWLVLKPGTLGDCSARFKQDSRLLLDVMPEEAFCADQTMIADRLKAISLAVISVLGVAIAFAGLTTMYTSVLRRRREIGTLRSLGFTNGDLLLSFLIESLIVGLTGGVIGEVLAISLIVLLRHLDLLINVGPVLFAPRVGVDVVVGGIAGGVALGTCGGLWPAVSASRLPLIVALGGH
jgi:putative ABC transport system permease protein